MPGSKKINKLTVKALAYYLNCNIFIQCKTPKINMSRAKDIKAAAWLYITFI
jgi:hypothetical protein